MTEATVEVRGLSELKAAFRKLGPEIAAGILKEALQAGALVLAQAITEAAAEHTRTGEMQKGITTAVVIDPSGMSGVARVGFGEQDYKAAWVEFGHRQVVIKDGERQQVGNVPAHPFVRPAFEMSKTAAKEAVAEVIQERVNSR